MTDRSARLTKAAWALLGASALFCLTYRVVFNFRSGDSDYIDHLSWAIGLSWPVILEGIRQGKEILWHIFVWLTASAGVRNIWKAAALATAGANAAAYLVVYGCLDRRAPEKTPRWLLAAVVLCVFTVSSLTLPGGPYYVGRGAVNPWHNPTSIMVRPFAAAVLFMTADIYDRRRGVPRRLPLCPEEGESPAFAFPGGFWAQFETPVFTRSQLVLYPLCLVLSAYAKPSFLQIFGPAIFLFLLADLIRTRGMLLPFCVKMAVAFLPAVWVLLQQVGSLFGNGFSLGVTALAAEAAPVTPHSPGAGISIYYLADGWTGFGPFLRTIFHDLKMLALPCAFPLFLLAAAPRRTWRDAGFRLGLVCALSGLLGAMFLHETGERSWHGNFTWGQYLGCWLLWSAAAGQYASLWGRRGQYRLARWGGAALLALHLACGAAYLAAILRTGEYYF